MSNLVAIDLFCGAGGFSAGLEEAGFEIQFAADWWKPAVRTYAANFGHPILEVDLASITAKSLWEKAGKKPKPIDLVVGGPPCQGFSIQRIGSDADKRNDLVAEFGRLVIEFQPRMFIMENVPGLLGARGKSHLTRFLKMMEDAGYQARVLKVNAAEWGVPQVRKRIVVAGVQIGTCGEFELGTGPVTPDNWKTVEEALIGLPAPTPSGTKNLQDPLHEITRLSPLNLERLKHLKPGQGMESLPIHLRAPCHRNGASNIGHRYVYGRLPLKQPANTITAKFDSFTRGRFAHPTENRNITLREGARLQTFPDSFTFNGSREEIAAQIGNAVPPMMACALANAARHALRRTRHAKLVQTGFAL